MVRAGVDYRLVYSPPNRKEATKNDLVRVDWAEEVRTQYFGKDSEFCWQSVLGHARRSDLTIIGQENKLLANYLLQAARLFGGPKIAFFGHGRNFQAADHDSPSERLKRFLIDKVDWWFSYTERSAGIVAQSGFPLERITVFNNAIDTSAIRTELAAISPAERAATRDGLFSGSENVGVYIGGLYRLKRISFLIDAAKRIRQAVPDFNLLIIGGGEDTHIAEAAARDNEWIHYAGPKFGPEKTLLVSLGRVLLMPGLVGLSILDSFAYGTPLVTTDVPYHSPEIDYLVNGVNGVIVREQDSTEAYASAVIRILRDEKCREHLMAGSDKALRTYTIEAMAERFSDGVIQALSTERYKRKSEFLEK